jgi:lactoylglutathione lyase
MYDSSIVPQSSQSWFDSQPAAVNATALNSLIQRRHSLFRRIDHVALDVTDIDRSVAFYEEHFGCELYNEQVVADGMRIAYLRSGDTILELVHCGNGKMNGFHFCFESDDFDADVTRLKNANIPVLTEPHYTGAREEREAGWRRTVFAGPDGEAIEFRG